MPELNEAQARALAEQTLKLSTAEACTVNISGNAGGNIRYARNTVSTAGAGAAEASATSSTSSARSAASRSTISDTPGRRGTKMSQGKFASFMRSSLDRASSLTKQVSSSSRGCNAQAPVVLM